VWPPLLDSLDLSTLREAWHDVHAAARADGEPLSPGVADFARDPDSRLAGLVEALRTDAYRPARLARVEIPKPDGGVRELHIPSVRDRVLERALLTLLTPVLDPLLGPASFGYRPGLGVVDAIQAVADLRDDGLCWAVRADVDECFPTLPLRRVRSVIDSEVDDSGLRQLLHQLLDRPRPRASGPPVARHRGVPQGAPLSPLWANVVLAEFDDHVLGEGFPLVRYADDMVVLGRTRAQAEDALAAVRDAARKVGIAMGEDKTRVVSFAEGFTFLGEDFGPRYPPVVDEHRLAEVERKVLYCGLQGSRVRIGQGRVRVETRDEEVVLDVPSGHVSRIVLAGSVGLTAGLRSWALGSGVDVVLLSRGGRYLGTCTASSVASVGRLRAQVAGCDEGTVLRLARGFAEAKLRHQVVVLQRLARPESAEAVGDGVAEIRRLVAMLPEAGAADEIMGVEGAAARSYYGVLGQVMPEELGFAGRTRRPPQDVVNAALSYGYAILLGECVSALHSVGLHPGLGVLHADDDGRPSLALDLMEEFRPLLVDRAVLTAVTRRRLRPEHGVRTGPGQGLYLTARGKEVLVGAYEERLLQTTRGALAGFSGTWRRHIWRQAERLAADIMGGDPWSPLSWR
jgi:CRISPR-associated protein Cas1